jgi:hypothetical protein
MRIENKIIIEKPKRGEGIGAKKKWTIDSILIS